MMGRSMAAVIAVLSQKGGTGKTTTVRTLTDVFRRAGLDTLAVDFVEHGYDIKRLGFGTVDTLHLLAEVLKIAFADRAQASGDPDFVAVPVERITSKAYADQRRAAIDRARAQNRISSR